LDDLHSHAATAESRLDDDRIAGELDHFLGLVERRDEFVLAGHDRDSSLARASLEATLSPRMSMGLGGGPMNLIPAFARAVANSLRSDRKP